MRGSPRAADAGEEEARGADIDDAVGGAAGFEAGVAEVFAVEPEIEAGVFAEAVADTEVGDHGGAEDELVFVVFELAVEPADARGNDEAGGGAPGGAEGGGVARDL